MMAFTCNVEPTIKYIALQNRNNFITLFRNGIFYISYVSAIENGENLLGNRPFLVLEGDLMEARIGGKSVHNEVIIDDELSVVELNKDNRPLMEVYPNPTSGEISISLDEENKFQVAKISISNSHGEKLVERSIQGKVSTLDLKFPPGVYFYIIESQHEIRSGKLIIL